MLILTRAKDEAVVLQCGCGVTSRVQVTQIRGGKQPKCRLGIDAPQSVAIRREELPGKADTEGSDGEAGERIH